MVKPKAILLAVYGTALHSKGHFVEKLILKMSSQSNYARVVWGL
jgi:hypothetical protein